MTKAQKAMLDSYNRSSDTELWHVYGRCSQAKYNAMDYCKNLMYEKSGYDGRITSYNTFRFSYAFRFIENGIEHLMYITHDHNRQFAIA